MAATHEYKCPCCGGAIAFDSSIQKMKCPYCDTEFEMETLQGIDEDLQGEIPDDMSWDMGSGAQWGAAETQGMRVYGCKSCGGQVVGDETLGATSCPYCGNPIVMMGQFAGDLRPDMVISFKLDKDAAITAYKQHVQGKKLLPKVFQNQNHIEEIKGIYVPFWMFDADANADIRYKATKVRHWSDSSFDYTETSFYSVFRGGNLKFAGVPVDGSSKMPDDLMESIEPYDMSAAVDFQTAYLAGYLADKYDVNSEACIERANTRIKRSTEQVFANTVKDFNTVTAESTSVRLNSGKAKYVLCPVWILNTTWNGQQYTFAMNGQTGKLVGDLPVDKKAKNSMFWKTMMTTAAVVLGVSFLLWLL